jgi:hypothetical protein
MNDCHDKAFVEVLDAVGRGIWRAAFLLCAAFIIAGIVVMAIGALLT